LRISFEKQFRVLTTTSLSTEAGNFDWRNDPGCYRMERLWTGLYVERFQLGSKEATLTKADLVEQVVRGIDLSRKDAEEAVTTVRSCLVDSLNAGEKIELRGFGSFCFRDEDPRQGRNPKTGEQVYVPAKKVVYFKPDKFLKELRTEFLFFIIFFSSLLKRAWRVSNSEKTRPHQQCWCIKLRDGGNGVHPPKGVKNEGSVKGMRDARGQGAITVSQASCL
jgi:integration host factor subunit beta